MINKRSNTVDFFQEKPIIDEDTKKPTGGIYNKKIGSVELFKDYYKILNIDNNKQYSIKDYREYRGKKEQEELDQFKRDYEKEKTAPSNVIKDELNKIKKRLDEDLKNFKTSFNKTYGKSASEIDFLKAELLKKAYKETSANGGHSDKGASKDKTIEIRQAYEILSDTNKYKFNLFEKGTLKQIIVTPKEFYDSQRALDYRHSATKEMFNAVANHKTLTIDELQDFLRDGADIDAVDKNGKNIIYFAFENKNIELLTILIKDSDKNLVNLQDSKKKSLLIFTIENELKDLVEQLLKNKEKDFLRTNDIGKSAISFVFNKIGNIVDPTSKKNNVEILIMLIKNGANLDIINTKRDTLLTFAVERENKELVELLLTKGINIHAVNSQRKSAIELAFQQKEYKDHEKVLIALIKSGAKVDIINTKGDTLLIFAADRGFKDLALLLIEGKNNDVNAVNARGKAAIDFALQSENIKIIQALVKAGANINVVDQDKNTLLMIAAKIGAKAKDLINQLINKGIDVNASNENGKTAIDFARDSGNAKIILTLEKAIESLKVKNKRETEGAKGSNKSETEGAKGSNKPGTEGAKGKKENQDKPGSEGTKGNNKPGTEGAKGTKGSQNKQDSDIETRDEHGNTPLMNAAKNGLDSLVKTLISKKANIKAINSEGKTAAHFARGHEKYEALKILV